MTENTHAQEYWLRMSAERALVKKHHPDQGGDADAFREITEAIEEARSRGQ